MKIDRTIKSGLCLGCGICEGMYPSKCSMLINKKGFYEPYYTIPLSRKEDETLSKICPSIYVIGKGKNGFWGKIEGVYEGWAIDDNIRYRAASGGITTALCLYLLESNKVHSVLQVGTDNDDYLFNHLKVSDTREQVIENAQSRYAPALIFNKITKILEEDSKSFAFVGKPCDVAGLQNLIRQHPQYDGRIRYYISIFCAGMPSYRATDSLIKRSGKTDNPVKIIYRGNGWPGYFTAKWMNGDEYKISYNESWGKVLGRNLGLRCKICPDGIGTLADIAVGDYWMTKDGYPDFTEQPGRCFIMARTKKGTELLNQASKSEYIHIEKLSIDKIASCQPYQAQRRKLTLWRLLPLQIRLRGLIKFKHLQILRIGLKTKPIIAIKTLIGAFKRFW